MQIARPACAPCRSDARAIEQMQIEPRLTAANRGKFENDLHGVGAASPIFRAMCRSILHPEHVDRSCSRSRADCF
jgi:hypothetical protein